MATFLKVIQEKVPNVPSNYSNEELASHIRHYFPNLGGPLQTMLNRFEALLKLPVRDSAASNNGQMSCMHCGSLLQVEEE